ncbi:uncharacterized protein LOC134197904 [Corticium candelabrum]|uniref:uncharacterized protein LOC134197904 n=1 Tax=Corticium candelabrum TaxID=121492 RepID=UPI002E253C33|nr:uncharacterized protein LOC134197904 [Corticium candelabrum]
MFLTEVQDCGKTLYAFGMRTHADYVKTKNFNFLVQVIKKLIVGQLEQNARQIRSCIDAGSIAPVKIMRNNGFNKVCSYEAAQYRHNQLFKAKDALDYYIQTVEAKCNVMPIESSWSSNLIAPTVERIESGLEIIDSPLLPGGMFFSRTCLYSATRDNLDMLRKLGYQFLVAGDKESSQWKPKALGYGRKTRYSILSTWDCTVTGEVSDDALVLLLKQARLAVVAAIECQPKAENGIVHFLCHFSSCSLQERVQTVLCDEIGFETSDYTPMYGNYRRCASYEQRV